MWTKRQPTTGELPKQTKVKWEQNERSEFAIIISTTPVLHVNIEQPKEDNETITRIEIKKIEQLQK